MTRLSPSSSRHVIGRWNARALAAALLMSVVACDQSPPATTRGDSVADTTATPTSARETASPTPQSVDARPRLVAFGDSLTAGLGVSAEQTYPAQLQRRLDAQGLHYLVVNAGVSGETTAGGLRRVPWILSGKPHMVILELGANDGLRGLSLTETRANLEAILAQFNAAHVPVLLAGMKLPPNYGQDYTAGFEALYRDLAASHALPIIPFFLEGVAGRATLNQADGIHPTAAGYAIVVENMMATLLPVLAEQQSERADHGRKAPKARSAAPASSPPDAPRAARTQ